jgi:hypothetical protein
MSTAADLPPVEWRRLREPRERLEVGPGGFWLGPLDGPRAHYLFATSRRRDELAQFTRSYASFQQRDGESELVFRGRGAAPAAAAERRMIAEWARQVAAETGGDGSPSPYGLAFAWHRGAATGGICDDLAVFASGEVRAGSCGAATEAWGRLSGEQLQRLYAWVDNLSPFQATGEQGVRADSLLERLIFAGRGKRPATSAEIAAIESLAAALHHEIQAANAAVFNQSASAAALNKSANAAVFSKSANAGAADKSTNAATVNGSADAGAFDPATSSGAAAVDRPANSARSRPPADRSAGAAAAGRATDTAAADGAVDRSDPEALGPGSPRGDSAGSAGKKSTKTGTSGKAAAEEEDTVVVGDGTAAAAPGAPAEAAPAPAPAPRPAPAKRPGRPAPAKPPPGSPGRGNPPAQAPAAPPPAATG